MPRGGAGFNPPHGMPPQPGAFPPMGGMAPGMNFGGGVPGGGGQASQIPPPMGGCGRLGLRCFELGPTDSLTVCVEVLSDMEAFIHQAFDRTERLQRISLSARPYVLLTLSPHSFQIVPVYGLQQYHVMGGRQSVLEGRYFAFLGTGNEEAQQSLHLVPQDTLDSMGSPGRIWAATEAAIDQWFQGQGQYPSTLMPSAVPNGANMEEVAVEMMMHCPCALVHIFGDSPHP